MQRSSPAIRLLLLQGPLAAAQRGGPALELLAAAAAVARAAPALLKCARGRLRLVVAAAQRPDHILLGHRPEACMGSEAHLILHAAAETAYTAGSLCTAGICCYSSCGVCASHGFFRARTVHAAPEGLDHIHLGHLEACMGWMPASAKWTAEDSRSSW